MNQKTSNKKKPSRKSTKQKSFASSSCSVFDISDIINMALEYEKICEERRKREIEIEVQIKKLNEELGQIKDSYLCEPEWRFELHKRIKNKINELQNAQAEQSK
jgi:hypothetical protein